jgi:hypothetical protein
VNVELQEFVANALRQLLTAIRDAQSSDAGDGEVNPPIWINLRQEAAKHGILESSNGKWIHMVEFDLAVTAGESMGEKGHIQIAGGAVRQASSRESNAQSTTVSRIRFSVPIAYPRSSA